MKSIKEFIKKEWFKIILLIVITLFLFAYWNMQRLEYNWRVYSDLVDLCDKDIECVDSSYAHWALFR